MSSMSTSSGDRCNDDDEVEYHNGRVVEDWRHPWSRADRSTGLGGFGEKHGIHSYALPIKYYQVTNPYEVIKNISEFLGEQRATRRQVSKSALVTASEVGNTQVRWVDEIALINGWWCGGERASSGDYYCNPDYPHPFNETELLSSGPVYDEETVEQRKNLARMAANLGLSSAVLVPIFDVSAPRAVTDWCRDHGIQYSDLRLEGMKKMARTWKTIHYWGKTKTEIAETFALPLTTLRSRIDLVEDFIPPDRPSIPVYKDEDKGGSQ